MGFGADGRFAVPEQAEALRGLVPDVVAGDLNTEPDNPAWDVLTEHGSLDGFGEVRPFPTLPG